MDLDELRAFVAVVEKGSLVSAAASLRFARATLRRRIDELEVRAGVRLLNRTDRGVTPTEAGALLAERARQILSDASGLLTAVREVAAGQDGELRAVGPVGLPPAAATGLVLLLDQLLPRVTAHLSFAADPLAALGEGIDFALYFGTRSAEGSWRSHDVVTISEGLFATPQWLAQHGPPKSLEALAKLPVLRWAEPGVDPNTLPLRAGGVMQLRPRIVSPDMHLLRQCALSSVGLAFVPDAASVPAVWSDGLVPVLPGLIGADLPLRIAVPAALSELPRVRAVFEALRSFLNVRS